MYIYICVCVCILREREGITVCVVECVRVAHKGNMSLY